MKFINSLPLYLKNYQQYFLRIPLFVFLLLFFVSCVSTTKLKQQISEKTSASSKPTELFAKQHLVLKADSILYSSASVEVTKKTSFFLPLIVYWGWGKTVQVDLPSTYFINIFNKVLISQNKDFQYDKLFGNKTLEIDITSLPLNFIYSLKSTYLFLPYLTGFGIYYSSEDIYPEKQKLEIKYRFRENDNLIKSGVKSLEMKYPVSNIFNPAAGNILFYIDDYKKEFEFISGKIIENVIDDL